MSARAKRPLPERLSFEDATFLNFERPSMPMNVGSVAIYEGSINIRPFVDHVDRYIDQFPRYLQRLAPDPLRIAHPAWIEDPQFDIHRHVTSMRLPSPGSDDQLAEAAGAFFATPLDRSKPLWEIRLVHGLDRDRTAHLAKVHHCMVDGVSGVSLLTALLDPKPRPPATRKRRRRPAPPLPSADVLVADAIAQRLEEQLRLSGDIWLGMMDPLRVVRRATSIAQAFEKAGPYLSVPAPHAPWNARLSSPSLVAWQALPFQRLREASHALHGTINDVVLCVLAGALGRYLAANGHRTQGVTLRVLAPVNVRSASDTGALGNRLSFLLCGLPVGVPDPVERFRMIHEEVASLKRAHQPESLDALAVALGNAPPMFQLMLGQTLTMPNTIANLVCTNVPGPLVPLYCMGHRMLEHYPWTPPGWRMGLCVAVMSYDAGMYFSFSADKKIPDDPRTLPALLAQEFDRLCDRIGVATDSWAEPRAVLPPEMPKPVPSPVA